MPYVFSLTKVNNTRHRYIHIHNYINERNTYLLTNMEHRNVHLLDLPDELLLTIMKKLKPNDILYSLLGVNKRFDRIADTTYNTYVVNFTNLSSGKWVPMDDEVFDRFCFDIMPRIYHKVGLLILDHWSMERVLLASQYPALRSITLSCFCPNVVLNCLKDGSSIDRLFEKQLKFIHVIDTTSHTSDELFTDACARIFAVCRCLSVFNVSHVQSKLSLYNRPSNTCLSSALTILSVVVSSFDDCLCLLDGRLDRLLSFSVKIDFINQRLSPIDNLKPLPNLTNFSLTSNNAPGYDQHVLPLLHRMSNLKRLTLCLTLNRLSFIDGTHLDKQILSYVSQLTTFIFHIRTTMLPTHLHHHVSADDVQKTFDLWKYGQVNCHVDYFKDQACQCHIYSVPFQMTCIYGVTNSFYNNSFPSVVDLKLFDVHPFEHIYFKWLASAFPSLKMLTVDNIRAPKYQAEFETMNSNQNSIISFPHLMMITLINAHIVYVEQFLRHTNTHLPRLSLLAINYEKLLTVTDNFTNDLTRVNCAQLKYLKVEKGITYPKHFYLYFPFLQ